MYPARKRIARRTFLRGLGAAIAMPCLEAMAPEEAPARLVFVYVPNGITMGEWTPPAPGANFTFSRILKPLEPFRERLLVLGGLDHHNATALGDGTGDHARAGACFLTGVHPRKTTGSDVAAGISADQLVAAQVAGKLPFPSLELGTEDSGAAGACDTGYSCAYSDSIAWRGPQSPLPPETNPRLVFERLFGAGDAGGNAAYRKSVLDLVQDDARRIASTLGAADRRTLDEYLYTVRALERRIERAETDRRQFTPAIERPAGIPVHFGEYLRLMYDLQVAALQGDLTRVITMMVAREGSTRAYPEIAVPDAHHPLTHHRNDAALIEKVTKINCFHTEQFAYFLSKLAAAKEGTGALLDRTTIVYASGISDGNAHSHSDLPVLVAGGPWRGNRYLRCPAGTPMTNLYVTLLAHMNVRAESFGDSTGKLERLTS